MTMRYEYIVKQRQIVCVIYRCSSFWVENHLHTKLNAKNQLKIIIINFYDRINIDFSMINDLQTPK